MAKTRIKNLNDLKTDKDGRLLAVIEEKNPINEIKSASEGLLADNHRLVIVLDGGDGGGDITVTVANITDASALGRSILQGADATAIRTLIAAAPTTVASGANNGLMSVGNFNKLAGIATGATAGATSATISDATVIGRAIITGADALAVRTTLGLGPIAVLAIQGDASNVLRSDGQWGKIGTSNIATGAINNALINNLADIALSKLGNLTALTLANTAVAAGDNLVVAFGKTQGQINDLLARVAALETP